MNKLKDIMNTNAFLGKGWSFPPRLTEDGATMVTYEQDIKQSLCVLLSTTPGERVNRYEYGCPLSRYAFEPMTTEVMARMRNDITRAILLFEPRIELEEVSFEEQAEKGVLLIQLTYTIVHTNSRSNMVYPFYLNEGTNSI